MSVVSLYIFLGKMIPKSITDSGKMSIKKFKVVLRMLHNQHNSLEVLSNLNVKADEKYNCKYLADSN